MSRQVIEGRYFVETPLGGRIALVLDSPHSGVVFPADFDTIAPARAIHDCGDAHVDELWSVATQHGATLIGALFPRAYIDTNRAEHDIDPELLDRMWPHDARPTHYSERGVGLLHRYAAPNVPLYDRRLSVAEVERRIHDYYTPYRQTLRDALDGARARHGAVWHVNCHSMSSRGDALAPDAGLSRPDVVVSDRDGVTADPAFSRWLVAQFTRLGLRAAYNTPYRGGDLVAHFGRPAEGVHSVQIELSRALYMNEERGEKHDGFAQLQLTLGHLSAALADWVRQHSEDV